MFSNTAPSLLLRVSRVRDHEGQETTDGRSKQGHMQETRRGGWWDTSRVNTQIKMLFIPVSNSPWMHMHFMGTAARTAIRQQSGKDLAHKGTEHTLDVPWHMCSRPYTAAKTPLIYTMPIHPSFIRGSTSPAIKVAPPRLSNQISSSIFCFTREQEQWADTLYRISQNSQNSQTSNVEKTAQV